MLRSIIEGICGLLVACVRPGCGAGALTPSSTYTAAHGSMWCAAARQSRALERDSLPRAVLLTSRATELSGTDWIEQCASWSIGMSLLRDLNGSALLPLTCA